MPYRVGSRGTNGCKGYPVVKEGSEEVQIDDDEPPRYMRLAFDENGRPWEVAALSFGGGARYLVIHAMPARKSVVEKMQRRMR